jgi:hypothetical protein
MATLQKIAAVLHGYPYTLRWSDFTEVKTSRIPPRQASTVASFNMTGWHVGTDGGSFKVQGLSVRVSPNKHSSWAVKSGKTATLLDHEQGHFDITGLIARDLARKVLDLSLPVSEVAALKEAGTTADQHKRYALKQFQKLISGFGKEAVALMNRLQSNTPGKNGLYDANTNHGNDPAAQARWDAFFKRMQTSTEDFGRALAASGLR